MRNFFLFINIFSTSIVQFGMMIQIFTNSNSGFLFLYGGMIGLLAATFLSLDFEKKNEQYWKYSIDLNDQYRRNETLKRFRNE